jgi:hypothetical protein
MIQRRAQIDHARVRLLGARSQFRELRFDSETLATIVLFRGVAAASHVRISSSAILGKIARAMPGTRRSGTAALRFAPLSLRHGPHRYRAGWARRCRYVKIQIVDGSAT